MLHITMRESVDSMVFIFDSGFSKTQKMCDKAEEKDLKMLRFVSDLLKTQEMCKKAFKNCYLQ